MYYLYGNDRLYDKIADFDTAKFETFRISWVCKVAQLKDENGNVLLRVVR